MSQVEKCMMVQKTDMQMACRPPPRVNDAYRVKSGQRSWEGRRVEGLEGYARK